MPSLPESYRTYTYFDQSIGQIVVRSRQAGGVSQVETLDAGICKAFGFASAAEAEPTMSAATSATVNLVMDHLLDVVTGEMPAALR